MKKLFPLAMYSLLIISTQRLNSDLHTTQKDHLKKTNADWTIFQEDAKGKAGVS
jgi:hypothetical protein